MKQEDLEYHCESCFDSGCRKCAYGQDKIVLGLSKELREKEQEISVLEAMVAEKNKAFGKITFEHEHTCREVNGLCINCIAEKSLSLTPSAISERQAAKDAVIEAADKYLSEFAPTNPCPDMTMRLKYRQDMIKQLAALESLSQKSDGGK